MQDGYSKGFYFVIFIVLAFFIYLAFIILPDRTRSVFVGEGSSMEPTLEDGAEIVVSSNRTPEVGEIIVFKCNDKCKDFPGEIFTKRLSSIDEKGCYWVLGDNEEVSYDSRAFGKLCADDLELYGVVIDIVSKQID
jgi:phage repressor protein C with HTH and peptisase S24 domain